MKSKGKSPRRKRLEEFFQRFRSNKMGMLGVAIVLFFAIMALFAPLIITHDPSEFGSIDEVLLSPSTKFLLGTDDVGRDIFSQLVVGSRVSMLIGLMAAGIAAGIGSLIGLVSGFSGGKLDELLMRFVDMLMAIPRLALMLVLAAIMGPSMWNIIIVIAILGWTSTSRVVRSQVLSVKERPFVEAARCLGASTPALIFHEIMPNVIPIMFAQTIMMVSNAIYSEAVLSFLGLGDPLHASWGMMLNFAFTSGVMTTAWWWSIPPGLAIAILVLGFTFAGSALNEILNPRYRTR